MFGINKLRKELLGQKHLTNNMRVQLEDSTEEVRSLRKEFDNHLWQTENPPKFKKGDKVGVVASIGIGKILGDPKFCIEEKKLKICTGFTIDEIPIGERRYWEHKVSLNNEMMILDENEIKKAPKKDAKKDK